MSVEKLTNSSQSHLPTIPFTQICNNVIYHIKNGDAFLVWSYLLSKSSNWQVIKQDIKKQYGFGNDKIKKIFSYLNRANLIKCTQKSCANGKFAQVDIHVQSGQSFNKCTPYIIDKKEENRCATGGSENRPAVSPSSGKREATKQRFIKNKYKNKNKDKNYCASSDARVTQEVDFYFDEFWKIYPVKINKKRAREIWDKKRLKEKAQVILADVANRIRNDFRWKDEKFITHAPKYLNEHRWEDEVSLNKMPPKSESLRDRLNRIVPN